MEFAVSSRNQPVVGDDEHQGFLDTETLLTVREVAALLKVPVSWVYEHTRRESDDPLPAIKVGKYLRFFKRDLYDHLETIRLKNHRRR